MTKKKRQRKERKHREKAALRREPEEIDDFPGLPPDPRAVERMTARIGRILDEQQFESIDEAQAFLNQYLSEGGASLEDAPTPSTPLERAQELVYDAFGTDDPQKRVDLAEEALKISEDCADAYVILAEESAEDAGEARELYEAGVRAGERALGEEIFTEEAATSGVSLRPDPTCGHLKDWPALYGYSASESRLSPITGVCWNSTQLTTRECATS
jgi:hypothetical protein